ncbi:MAG: PAS domain S-box protein [Bernardetiaceae bacterium]|jgi:PAS domain S-box-containing protein|nr:PAS domain S-box protein [Bernardetiaceae bacterium]
MSKPLPSILAKPGASNRRPVVDPEADEAPFLVLHLAASGEVTFSNQRNPDVEKYLVEHFAEKLAARLGEVLAQNRPGELELLVGSRFYLLTLAPVAGRVRVEAKDITERKLAEEKIRASVNLYRLLSENSHDLIALHYPDGKWQYVSQAAKDLLGYEPEDMVGTLPSKLYHPDDVEQFRTAMERLRQGQSALTYQCRLRRKDGTFTWFETIVKPVYDAEGYIANLQSASRDISERKQAETEVSTALSRLSALIQNLEAGIVVEDENGQVVLVNKRFAEIFAITTPIPKLLHKPSDRIMKMVQAAAENPTWFAERTEKVLTRKTVLASEEVVCHDGRILERDFVPIYDNGIYRGHLWEYKDVTSRKQAERELIRAKEEALQSMRAKETFLSTMSHEIRTPMNAVIGLTHLLLQENPKPEQLDNLQTLKFSAENLLVLINDILDFSKIEAGKITFEETDFHLRDFLHGIRNSFDFRAKEKGISFKVRFDSELPEQVVGDTVRLSQILTNLVSNAVKFTETGSVVLDVMQEAQANGRLKINFVIADTGIGIAPDKLSNIFDQFTQASADTTRKYGGTGLGLAIVKRLLEMQGSQIEVESQVGQGSKFSFSLWFKPSQVPPASHLPASGQASYAFAPLEGVQVLLVEDNEINQMVASKFLSKWGVAVDCAADGFAALEKIKTQAYQLVLMDLQMPGKDGYQTARDIRALGGEYFQKVPIVALTASAMADVKAKVLGAGMDDHVSKPFNPGELYQKIARYGQRTSQVKIEALPSGSPPASPQPDSPGQLINYAVVHQIAMGDEGFRRELTQVYVRTFHQLAHDHATALRGKNATALRRLIHKMAPTLKTLAASELEQLLQNSLPLLAQRAKKAAIEAEVARFGDLCQAIIVQLEAEL